MFLERALALNPPSSCGDCHCIPESPHFKCPEDIPKYNWEPEEISFFKNVKLDGLFESESEAPGPFFDCVPLSDILSFGIPGLEPDIVFGSLMAIVLILQKPVCESLGSTLSPYDSNEVCGFRYNFADQTIDHCPSSYDLVTYHDSKSAKEDGAIVTHEGSCGYCSSAQDLSAYLNTPDFTEPLLTCVYKVGGVDALTNPNNIAGLISCFQEDIGLTLACSVTYFVNVAISEIYCADKCPQPGEQIEPANGPLPHCKLNDCLQCDEDNAGPFFVNIARRTRRNSGILSEIARPCELIPDIVQEACPKQKKAKTTKSPKAKNSKTPKIDDAVVLDGFTGGELDTETSSEKSAKSPKTKQPKSKKSKSPKTPKSDTSATAEEDEIDVLTDAIVVDEMGFTLTSASKRGDKKSKKPKIGKAKKDKKLKTKKPKTKKPKGSRRLSVEALDESSEKTTKAPKTKKPKTPKTRKTPKVDDTAVIDGFTGGELDTETSSEKTSKAPKTKKPKTPKTPKTPKVDDTVVVDGFTVSGLDTETSSEKTAKSTKSPKTPKTPKVDDTVVVDGFTGGELDTEMSSEKTAKSTKSPKSPKTPKTPKVDDTVVVDGFTGGELNTETSSKKTAKSTKSPKTPKTPKTPKVDDAVVVDGLYGGELDTETSSEKTAKSTKSPETPKTPKVNDTVVVDGFDHITLDNPGKSTKNNVLLISLGASMSIGLLYLFSRLESIRQVCMPLSDYTGSIWNRLTN